MKSAVSSMTIRGALLLTVGFALQLATLLGYVSADEAAVFNDKIAHLVGAGTDVVGLIMVVWGRLRATKPIGSIIGVALAAVLLASCAGRVPDAWAVGCSSYARTLTVLAGYKNEGRLSPTTIGRVDQLVAVAGPICESTAPPDSAGLDRLDAALFEMTKIKERAQ